MDIVWAPVVSSGSHDSPCLTLNDGNGVLKTSDCRHITSQFNKSTHRLDLWSHGPAGKSHGPQFCRRRPRDLFLVLGPEVLKHSINVREDKKRIGLQGLSHDRRREVLIDDGFNTLELALLAADDGHTAASGADDNRAGIQ